jgi:queuine tRNA-ribosyltransferase
MYEIIETVAEHMPRSRPRYLMGVGTPSNIIESVARGVDMFDCVMPARNGRHGHFFTWGGVMNLGNEKYAADRAPVDDACGCPVCRTHSRAYLRHLFKAGEALAPRLAVIHNLWFYNELLSRVRDAIDTGTFESFRAEYSEALTRRI